MLSAEELLRDPTCATFAHARLLACILPTSADLLGGLDLAYALPQCLKLYQELDTGKLYIPRVKQALEEAIADHAEQDFAPDEVYLTNLACFTGKAKKIGKGQYRPVSGNAQSAAERQKEFILSAHSKHQTSQVEQGLLDLMKNQLQIGKPAHLCKSLCALAKEMETRHDFALAMRLYTAGKLANADDAVCHNGYAETLRTLGQAEAVSRPRHS